MRRKNRMSRSWLLVPACALVLGWSVLGMSDFYVIPLAKSNYSPVSKTGLATCYKEDPPLTGNWVVCGNCADGDCTPHGQDGRLQKGISWPNPRFTDNGDGTVTDNLTGLIWLGDAGCIGKDKWQQAFMKVGWLNAGFDYLCSGYTAGTFDDWRLPNLFELESLRHMGCSMPALPNRTGTGCAGGGDDVFSGVPDGGFWSSTGYLFSPSVAWIVGMIDGDSEPYSKVDFSYYVWPVRDGK